MSLFDAILSLAGLSLWLLWREAGFLDRSRLAPTGLLSTLRPTQPPAKRGVMLLVGLVLLLVLRAVFYWHIGGALNWMPRLHLIAAIITFRSDSLVRMGVFSVLSFLQMAAIFYFCLLLLSAINRDIAEQDLYQKRVRLHLGWLDRWPAPLKLLAPLPVGALGWAGLSPVLVALDLIPRTVSWSHLAEQSLVVGLSAFWSWKLFIIIGLLLHLISSYVFMGNLAFWSYVNATARNLLRPLSGLPLQLGRIDLAPIAAMVLVVVLTELGARQLIFWFSRLPV